MGGSHAHEDFCSPFSTGHHVRGELIASCTDWHCFAAVIVFNG
jgi:hypothetical protein